MATRFSAITELFLGGAWVSANVLGRDPITITRGRSAEGSNTEPSSCSLTLNNQTGDYLPRNPVGAYYGQIDRNTPLRVRKSTTDENYLALPGDFESYVSTPDNAALDITGDIDIRVDMTLQTWHPTNQYGLARKWVDDDAAMNNQGSWAFDLKADGKLRCYWTTTGAFSSATDATSTVAIGLSFFTRLAVRVTIDVDNGAAGRDIKFYTSTTGVTGTWTQLGATVTQVGVTSISAGSAPLEVGRTVDGSSVEGDTPSACQGRVHAFQMRSGIGGTVVANPKFDLQDSLTTSFTDSASRVWTLQGSAVMVNAGARFHGEVSAWPPRWDKTGRDVYSPIEAYGVLSRLGQGQAALKSVLYRLMTTASDVVAYWPCEDPDGSDEFGSALSGAPTMTHPSGDTTNATYDRFYASSPLPEATGVQWQGQVPIYTSTNEIQVGFLMHVPAGGVASTSQICRIRTTGSALTWTLHVNTSGDLRLQAFDSDDVQIADSGFITSPAVNGKRLRISINLVQNGSDINWSFASHEVIGGALNTSNGTLTNQTVGRATWIYMNVGGVLTDTVLGHITVKSNVAAVTDTTADQIAAYQGETATARILRLCREENMPVAIVGDITDASLMGPQLPMKLVDLLQECAATDLGILYEPRGFLGLEYRTRASLYSQEADLTLNYKDHTIFSIEPVEDDDAIRNDITVSRILGSSVRASRETVAEGPLSVEAVGRYDEQLDISLFRNTELYDQARWRLHLGTVDEARYPVLGVNLSTSAFLTNIALTDSALAIDVGERIVVTNLPTWASFDDVQQIVQGYFETITSFDWFIDINCSPASPWDVALWEDSSGPGEARYSSDGTTTTEALDTTETGVDVTTPVGPVWGTADLPYDIVIGGERMTVTAVSGAAAAQTFTVIRSVNDVVKTHATGATVQLFKPAIFGL